jgi:Tol biopolymer transport system component
VLLFVLTLMSAFGVSAQDDVPPGLIAFTSDESGVYQIYTMRGDGSDVTQLTDGEYAAFLPLWSPDSSKIAYLESTSDLPLTDHPLIRLMVMNADGSEPVEITRDPQTGFIMNPNQYVVWSPDSRHIAYALFTDGDPALIEHYVHDLDTGEAQAVALPDGEDTDDISQIEFWSDGSLLLAAFNLYRTEADGSNPVLLYDGLSIPSALSPDETQIALIDGRDLVIISADGSEQTVLLENLPGPADTLVSYGLDLGWSSDGAWIWGAVRLTLPLSIETTATPTPAGAEPPPFEALFVVRADGSDYRTFISSEQTVNWSPDSSAYAFATLDVAGNVQLVIANADGSNAQTITSGANHAQPSWGPA